MYLNHPIPWRREEAENPRIHELKHWLEVVHQLPAVRREKVEAVREALRFSRYEDERMLDTAIGRLSPEVGIRCGGEFGSILR